MPLQSPSNATPSRLQPPSTDHDAADNAIPPVPRPSVYTATTPEELNACLADLTIRENAVNAKLDSLLASQAELTHTLSRLDLLRAHYGTQVVASRTLSNTVLSSAANTAYRVSSAVRRLDTEQQRVRETLAVVDHVAELKACVLGVTQSMGTDQDWETAANYLHRAAQIPQDIVNGEIAEIMIPSAEVPDPPRVTLHNAAESLCGLFLRNFEDAAKRGNGEEVTRFFKLFPLIGRSDVGLDVYGKYVCTGVAARARRAMNGKSKEIGDYWYAERLTALFEHIATIVEQHGALVEMCYGKGRMGTVVKRLQGEADVQGGIVVDAFCDERALDRRLTEIKSYAFSFLVQSFMSVPRGMGMGTPRSASPAPGSAAAAAVEENDDGGDVKEANLLLEELSVMLGRWCLYCRFLARKALADTSPPPTPSTVLTIPPVITSSTLSSKIQDRLVNPFLTISTFFCRRSVEKAFQLDEPPADLSLSLSQPVSRTSNPPFITSAVDDVMYIVKKLLERALSTSHSTLTCTVIATVSRILSADFVGMIQRKMRDESYPRAAIQGQPPPEEKVIAFLVLINNLDTSADYIHRIVAGLFEDEGSAPLSERFPFENDATAVTAALKNLEASFETKTGELISGGVNVVFNQVVKPRLRPLLAEAFRDVDYMVVESSSYYGGEDDGGAEDAVKTRFRKGWEGYLGPLKRIVSDRAYARVLFHTANYVSALLEKKIWGWSGRVTELGAVRLEGHVKSVVDVVVRAAGETAGGGRGLRQEVREMFERCRQICEVCNLEEEEVKEVLREDESGYWRLEKEERRRAREMVVRG